MLALSSEEAHAHVHLANTVWWPTRSRSDTTWHSGKTL